MNKQRKKCVNCDCATYKADKDCGVECKLPKVDIKDLDVPNWEVGTLTEAWEECGYTNAILNDFTLADMGKVGEEFVEKLGKDPNTSVSAMIGLLDKTDK